MPAPMWWAILSRTRAALRAIAGQRGQELGTSGRLGYPLDLGGEVHAIGKLSSEFSGQSGQRAVACCGLRNDHGLLVQGSENAGDHSPANLTCAGGHHCGESAEARAKTGRPARGRNCVPGWQARTSADGEDMRSRPVPRPRQRTPQATRHHGAFVPARTGHRSDKTNRTHITTKPVRRAAAPGSALHRCSQSH